MSNYNSLIEQNNTELEGILESIKSLPDAETSVETATITITGEEIARIVYVDVNGSLRHASCSPGTTLQSIVGSEIVFGWSSDPVDQQVTGINIQFTSNISEPPFICFTFEDFYQFANFIYFGIIQDSEVTIYAATN